MAGSGEGVNPCAPGSSNILRLIGTIGWSIYPVGHFLGYLAGAVAEVPLNCGHILADLGAELRGGPGPERQDR